MSRVDEIRKAYTDQINEMTQTDESIDKINAAISDMNRAILEEEENERNRISELESYKAY